MTHSPRLAKTLTLLLLLLVFPSVALAAPEEAPPQRLSQGARIGAELGLGALTGLGGLFLGAGLVGPSLCAVLGNGGSAGACLTEGIIGAGAGIMLSVPLGVFWGGALAGADGKLGFTYLGALAGGAVGGLLVAATWTSSSVFSTLLLFPFLPLIGSIIDYELSVSPEPPKVVLRGARLHPLLSVSPHGGFVGLGGHF